ncbi:hypothetical protein H2198_000299 [Neophaeococcomyces mojaviensis]|uniref:Uncharacterized protein n=1 Tax=Neophaeococcomyces mojaviensis TaxID=3383035 RepID=A0ACC3AK96_9EURO|nr:hypothetical protein H2198_000299 [Knufia sp. JES_112]
MYFGGVTIGPVISGPMALHVGWRNFWWFNVALNGAIALAVLLGFPETRWHRVHPAELSIDGQTSSGLRGQGFIDDESEMPQVIAHENITPSAEPSE